MSDLRAKFEIRLPRRDQYQLPTSVALGLREDLLGNHRYIAHLLIFLRGVQLELM